MTFSEQLNNPFCEEKQKNDKLERAGIIVKVKPPKSVYGEAVYTDLDKTRIDDIKKNRKKDLQLRKLKWEKKLYKDAISTIPIVPYNPIAVLREMKEKKTNGFFNSAANFSSEG